MERVRAKFRVSKIELTPGSTYVGKSESGAPKYEPCTMHSIILNPVTGGKDGDENSQFFASTPTGEIRLGTINAEAAGMLELNKEFYIDFTPAS